MVKKCVVHCQMNIQRFLSAINSQECMIQLFAAFVALLLYPVILMVWLCSNPAALLAECNEECKSQLQLILLLTWASLILYILSIVLIGFALLNRQSEIGRMLTTHSYIVVCIGLFAHVCNLLELNNKSKQLRISISAPILCALCLCFIQKKIFTN